MHTLRTDPDIGSRPLDTICTRQLITDIADCYTRAVISAGFTRSRMPFHSKEEITAFLMALPSRRVVSMMQFHYVQDVRREWKINDLRDNRGTCHRHPLLRHRRH